MTKLTIDFTKEMQETIIMLGDAWNKFLEIDNIHPTVIKEFNYHIHQCQRIVASSPTFDAFNELLEEENE
jgi:hypothetical protein